MSVWLPDAGGVNMFNVFSTFDFLLANNVRPIVELGFMPALLASNSSQTVRDCQLITSGGNILLAPLVFLIYICI
jgi:hypothetical protein